MNETRDPLQGYATNEIIVGDNGQTMADATKQEPPSDEWLAYVTGAFGVGMANSLLTDSDAKEFATAIECRDIADAEAWVLSVVFRLCMRGKEHEPTNPSIAVLETLARAAGVIP